MATTHPAPEWTLGDRITKARKGAQLEIQELAAELGVSPAAVSKWENDHSKPRDLLHTLSEIAELCDVPRWWLAGFDYPPDLDSPHSAWTVGTIERSRPMSGDDLELVS